MRQQSRASLRRRLDEAASRELTLSLELLALRSKSREDEYAAASDLLDGIREMLNEMHPEPEWSEHFRLGFAKAISRTKAVLSHYAAQLEGEQS